VGDTYVLKTVIHDWDDASCVRVLRHCRAKLSAAGASCASDKATINPRSGESLVCGTV